MYEIEQTGHSVTFCDSQVWNETGHLVCLYVVVHIQLWNENGMKMEWKWNEHGINGTFSMFVCRSSMEWNGTFSMFVCRCTQSIMEWKWNENGMKME